MQQDTGSNATTPTKAAPNLKMYEVQLKSVWQVDAYDEADALKTANDLMYEMLGNGDDVEGIVTEIP